MGSAEARHGQQEEPAPTSVIAPRSEQPLLNLRELWDYRILLVFLVWRNIKARYAQSILGVGWAIIQPLFYTVIFTIIFGNFAKIDSQGVPYAAFSMAATVPWAYFSNALNGGATAIVANSSMVTRVYVPRLILPLSAVLEKLVDFAISLVLLVAVMAWFGIAPRWEALALPVLLLSMVAVVTGASLWLSALAAQYRDVRYALTFLVQLLMYVSPVIYPVDIVPERYRLLYGLNPMVGVLDGFRAALLGTGPIPWDLLGVGAVVTVAMLVVGLLYFRRVEEYMADVV